MKKRRRHFTLLEVLIALVLITTTLPLLIAPYFYESLNLMQTTKAFKMEKSLQEAKALLLESLHTKKINPFGEPSGEWTELLEMPQVNYKFTRLKPKGTEKEEALELWEFALRIKDFKGEPLKYEIVVKR